MSAHPHSDAASTSGRHGPLPRRLGRYILLRELHGGGMTEVYIARFAKEIGPVRPLVIKLLPKGTESNVDAEARFLEEARIVLNLTHGNIATAFEFSRAEGRPFLVMEYIPGPSLKSLLRAARTQQRPLTIEDVVFIGREVARALGYAHSFKGPDGGAMGLVHQDISPDNVLISTAGQVKLTDFGIARFVSHGATGTTWGKAAYVAPEVAAGQQATPTSDLYSLGVVLNELVTGSTPFTADSDSGILALAAVQAPASPSTERPDIPDQLEQLILSLLSKDPNHRPESAARVEIALQGILAAAGHTYTESDLSQIVVDLMGTESYADPVGKGQLRTSLLNIGRGTDAVDSTEQILNEGTVPLTSLDPLTVPSAGQKPGRRPLRIALGLVLLLAVLGAVAFLAQRTPPASQAVRTPVTRPKTQTPAPPAVTETRKAPAPVQQPVAPKTSPPKPVTRARPRANISKPAAPAVKQHGWLNINSRPWSYVTIDGKRLKGHTPHRRVKLTAGPHTLVFENPELGLKSERKVTVEPFGESNIGVKLGQ